jgi:hypothetical protein
MLIRCNSVFLVIKIIMNSTTDALAARVCRHWLSMAINMLVASLYQTNQLVR